MGERTGADLFAAELKAHGIETVFGVPGEENTALVQAFERHGIALVLVRHEQSAAYIASVLGRLTGRPTACLSTLGPGAINLLGGVADAMLDRVPLLAITAQAPRDRLHRTASHQVIDLDAMFAPVTKLTRTIAAPAEIPGAIAEAMRQALAPRPGAVHLSLPQDVASAEAPDRPASAMATPPATEPAAGLPAPESLLRGADLLARAERPIVLAGAGVLRQAAVAPLRAFLAATGLPMAHTLAATGLLPEDDPRMLGPVGLPFRDHVDAAFEAADLVVAIGFDPEEVPAEKVTDGGRVPVLVVSETALPADTGWTAAGEVIGGLASGLRGLTRAWEGLEARPRALPAFAVTARDARRRDLANVPAEEEDGQDTPPSPRAILPVVQGALTEADIVVSGVGLHKMAVARLLRARSPGQVIVANGLAGMGIALPGAIAAARWLQSRGIDPAEGRALAIAGDGEFLMNLQEMETAARLDLPLTVLLLVDDRYALIEAEQRAETGRSMDLSFGNPAYADLARSFGWREARVAGAGELAPALAHARTACGPVLLTCPIRYHADIATALGGPVQDRAA